MNEMLTLCLFYCHSVQKLLSSRLLSKALTIIKDILQPNNSAQTRLWTGWHGFDSRKGRTSLFAATPRPASVLSLLYYTVGL